MNRTKGYVLAAAILLASFGIAALLVAQRPEPERREPPSQIPFASTAPAVAGSGAIPVYGSGTVRPRVQVDVAAGVSGRVVWVDPAFESGGRVTEGQVVFRLDDADYRHRREQARASVAVQQVELLKVEEEARIAKEQYAAFRSRAGDGQNADVSPLAQWEPQLEAARAALERDRALLAEAELLLSRTAVQAPFDAVVRHETVGVGQFVTAGMSVGAIYASDAVEIVVSLSDADAALIPGLWELRAGSGDTRVAARVIARHGTTSYAWAGTVDRFEAAVDEGTRTLDVIVRVPNPFVGGSPVEGRNGSEGAESPAGLSAPPLLVGQFVDVEIGGAAPEAYFRIRRLALRPGNEVWALRDDAVTIVPVRVLQRFNDDVYVTGGLQDGQKVVVGGIQFATEGMRVRTAE